MNSEKAQAEIVKGKSREIEQIYIMRSYQVIGIGQHLFDYAKRITNEKLRNLYG
nr:hypothetical protein [uncultured Aquimarina sp.]